VIAKRLNDALSAPVALDGRTVYTSGSIGVLLPGELPASAEEVMRDADAAMHAAKRRGMGRSAVFDAGMRGRAMERLELEADLRRALETDELVPTSSRSWRPGPARSAASRRSRALSTRSAGWYRPASSSPSARRPADRAARPPAHG
jgi:hypothetical protein